MQAGVRYVEKDLIPRLNGFELLMASYAMAHLKLDLLLMETGYKPINQKRFNVFLTNSLEEHHEHTGTLFSSYLANESKEADRVKKETPVMVVMGNPPYSVSSSNKSKWIQDLLKDYKKDLNERKINLDDDYIKFIRYGQHFIEKNEEGILAYISNNSFIDGLTHRQMRKSLLESFDTIYILDLHGDSKKQEVCPDGSKDENVFDIMQGVSINIFIKKKSKSTKLADVFHYDLYGKRNDKYTFLFDNSLNSIEWHKLKYNEPNYFFVKKNFNALKSYEQGFKIENLMPIYVTGIETIRDSLTIHFDKDSLNKVINDFISLDEQSISQKYDVTDARDWKISRAKKDLIENINQKDIFQEIQYRLFDKRPIYYSGQQNGFVCNTRYNVMKHMLKDNIGLLVPRQTMQDYRHVFISDTLVDGNTLSTARKFGSAPIFPLYLYPDKNSLDNERIPNLDLEIVKEIEEKLNLKFVNEKLKNDTTTFAPIDLLDYVYAILHSPNYRRKYKEFLKIDFPRVPYPEPSTFWRLVNLGSELRALHLMKSDSVNDKIIDIEGEGDMIITNKLTKKDTKIENDLVTIKLNDDVSIINIPALAWEFYIGGYQPAQKWLKDRAGRELSRTDLKHYNKIINALVQTDEIMKKIDRI